MDLLHAAAAAAAAAAGDAASLACAAVALPCKNPPHEFVES